MTISNILQIQNEPPAKTKKKEKKKAAFFINPLISRNVVYL